MSLSSPNWWSELQLRFGNLLLTPLGRDTGTLRALLEDYDPILEAEAQPGAHHSARERLGVYHRQYWFRLFTVLQGVFPLTARLLGHWTFNDYACRFLVAHPPRGWDIDAVCDGFDGFLEAILAEPSPVTRGANAAAVEPAALVEAARIDAAFHRILRAPETAPYRPRPEEAARLESSRLIPSPATIIVTESWPLCEMRQALKADPGESPVPLRPRLAEPRAWLVSRRAAKVGLLPLELRESELLRLVMRHPIAEALALLEAACPPEEQASLPARAERWLARSVELGLWIGLEGSSS